MNWKLLILPVLATIGVPAGIASAQTPLGAEKDHVVIRSTLDGSGPSHLIARGRALIVLDPNNAVAIRYPLDADDKILDQPRECSLPRNFSPRFVQPGSNGIRVIGEELQPGEEPSTARLPILDLNDATLLTMPVYDPTTKTRPPVCGAIRIAAVTIPSEARPIPTGFLIGTLMGTAVPAKGGIRVGPDPGAELFNARSIGSTDGFGTAVIRREIVGGEFGRVNIAVWITLYLERAPTSIRLIEHAFNAEGKIVGLTKRGFDYAAVVSHSLFIMGTICPDSFCIRRYDLSRLRAMTGPRNNAVATIDLTEGTAPGNPEDAPLTPLEKAAATTGKAIVSSPSDKAWSDALVSAVSAYAFNSWTYPRDRRLLPCGDAGPDRCDVRLRDGRLVNTVNRFPTDVFVSQKYDEPADAQWIGPRNLIDEEKGEPTDSERGIPYSFGGGTKAEDFLGAITTPNGRPIGHIRDKLEGVDTDNYPVGIDCSRFVWRIFGILLDTADWIDNPPATTDAKFVKDLRTARPGDLLVKKGHIVIFNRRAPSGANLGVEVFEATSRCGRVCRSVYDADFFNGWRIIRLRQMAPKGSEPFNNPYWPELDNGP